MSVELELCKLECDLTKSYLKTRPNGFTRSEDYTQITTLFNENDFI